MVKNMLSMCSAPLEVLISVLYWGIRAVSYSQEGRPGEMRGVGEIEGNKWSILTRGIDRQEFSHAGLGGVGSVGW